MRIVDMHCDTISTLYDKRAGGAAGESLRKNTGHVDLERMAGAGYLLQNFALFVKYDKGADQAEDPWERMCRLYGYYREELAENRDIIEQVLSYEDIEKNRAAGKMSALLTVEEGAVCKGEPDKLRRLYDMGVRMLTLTWNFPNELGFPVFCREWRDNREKYLHTPNPAGGLTERGKSV